jgi:hypothetical protein
MIVFLSKIPEIEEKLKKATNSNYEIGVLIGSYLPYFILVILAYLMYNSFKNKNNE